MCMACLQALSRLLHCFNEALYMLRGAKAPTGRSELTKINTSSRCPPVVCTSDGAEWQERTLYLALTWMEIAHEAALFWPEALPWMFWPMTLELKRPKQTAPPPPPSHREPLGSCWRRTVRQTVYCWDTVLVAATVTADRWKQKWDTPARIWDDNEAKRNRRHTGAGISVVA